jgi:hypothetical protein
MKLVFAIVGGMALINLLRKGVGLGQLFYLTPILILVCAYIAMRGKS